MRLKEHRLKCLAPLSDVYREGVQFAWKGIRVRVLVFRVLGVALVVLSIALAGGVSADSPAQTAKAPECAAGDVTTAESAAESAADGKTPDGKTPAANGADAPQCAAKTVAEKRPSFDDLLEGREVVPLNTRGYNYKRPDEIRGEVPSRNSTPPRGVPARKERKPDSSP